MRKESIREQMQNKEAFDILENGTSIAEMNAAMADLSWMDLTLLSMLSNLFEQREDYGKRFVYTRGFTVTEPVDHEYANLYEGELMDTMKLGVILISKGFENHVRALHWRFVPGAYNITLVTDKEMTLAEMLAAAEFIDAEARLMTEMLKENGCVITEKADIFEFENGWTLKERGR